MFPISEPTRGLHLLQRWNETVYHTATLRAIVPILADVFVFSYPLFLAAGYIAGIIKQQRTYKIESLTIFTSAIAGFLCNSIIQTVFEKQRPELYITNKAQLILSHLPTDPFPSDHATVSAAIATTTLLLGYQSKNPLLKGIGWFFTLASITMGVCRVGVAVHWPTDVLIGWILGILIGSVIVKCLTSQLTTLLYHPAIKLETWILGTLRPTQKKS